MGSSLIKWQPVGATRGVVDFRYHGNLQWRHYHPRLTLLLWHNFIDDVLMSFRWLSLSLSLFYVMFENLVVARAVQYMPNPCVQRHNLKGLLEPHVFLVHRVPNGIAIKPLLECWRTWSCLEKLTYCILVRLKGRQRGSYDTLSHSQESDISITGLHLMPRNHYGKCDQKLT